MMRLAVRSGSAVASDLTAVAVPVVGYSVNSRELISFKVRYCPSSNRY